MGHEFVSPLRRWDVVAGLCQSIGAKTFVEVGCKEGRTTGFVLANCPDIHVIAIDPWIKQEASADPTRETYEAWDFAEIESQFWDNVCSCKWNKLAHSPDCASHRCTMVQDTSEQAAKLTFQDHDETFDVVFIDALHDYDSVMQDISLWWPKVREGGFICGHDYQHKFPGVMRAVADHFPLMRVGLCPDSVWFVQKDAGLTLRAAA